MTNTTATIKMDISQYARQQIMVGKDASKLMPSFLKVNFFLLVCLKA
jgi:hypothetical protein